MIQNKLYSHELTFILTPVHKNMEVIPYFSLHLNRDAVTLAFSTLYLSHIMCCLQEITYHSYYFVFDSCHRNSTTIYPISRLPNTIVSFYPGLGPAMHRQANIGIISILS